MNTEAMKTKLITRTGTGPLLVKKIKECQINEK